MLMKDDKNSKATLILSKMQPNNPMDDRENRDTQEEVDEYQAAADDILAAIEQKDPKALAESLRAFQSMCMDEGPEEASEME
jgi:predicted lipid-binding transport protein (Tim44 family)